MKKPIGRKMFDSTFDKKPLENFNDESTIFRNFASVDRHCHARGVKFVVVCEFALHFYFKFSSSLFSLTTFRVIFKT